MADRHGAAAADTAVFVPLADVLKLAQLGKDMRRAQQRYFAARKAAPTGDHREQLSAARDLERRFDRECAELIARERVCLPGMEGGGE